MTENSTISSGLAPKAKDEEHQRAINREILRALMALEISQRDAKKVIRSVALGNIPNMRILY